MFSAVVWGSTLVLGGVTLVFLRRLSVVGGGVTVAWGILEFTVVRGSTVVLGGSHWCFHGGLLLSEGVYCCLGDT